MAELGDSAAFDLIAANSEESCGDLKPKKIKNPVLAINCRLTEILLMCV